MTRLARLRRLLAAVLTVAALALSPALAQTQTQPDYDTWARFAAQVEQAVDGNAATADALAQMRERAVAWRAQFAEVQKTPSTRAATLREQISALGPAPAEGKTEPDDIAARRKQLTAELGVEQAPALRATEAYSRADGLVAAIDRALRDRQASEVLRVSPSPLLPSSWVAAMDDVRRITAATGQELAADIGRARSSGRLGQVAPAVLGMLLLAGVMLTVARRWVLRLPAMVTRRASENAAGPVAFGVSLAQIVLPVAAVWMILAAVRTTTLTGSWTDPVIEAAGLASLTLFGGIWIAGRMFPMDAARSAFLHLAGHARNRARRLGCGLAAAVALHQLIARPYLPLGGFKVAIAPSSTVPQGFSEAAAGVLHLPILLLGAVTLYRLGHLLRRPRTEEMATGERVLAALGSLVRIVAIAAPLAALAGYISAANATLWPTATTLGLAGLIVVLQRFLTQLWLLARRRPADAADSLAPVLIGLALAVLALPALALIWGARLSDLAEAWTRFSTGVRVGTVRLSPGSILTFIIVFALGYSLTRAAQGALRTSVLPRTRIDKGAQAALVSGIGYIGIFIAAVLAITSAGIDLSSLAIVAGALSVGIGFGLQNIVSNFVSGIILLIERPVTEGDWVKVGTAQGYVRRISVRSTLIQTFDRTEVVVPNSDLITKEVTNWTRGSLTGRVIVPVSVAYGSDTRKVDAVLREIAEDQPTVLIDPKPVVAFVGFGADGLDFELRAILSDINQGISVSSEIRHQIIARFAEAGIEMPFGQRDVWLHNAETLAPAGPAASAQQGEARAKAPAAAEDAALFDPHIASAAGSGIEQAGADADEGGADGEGGR